MSSAADYNEYNNPKPVVVNVVAVQNKADEIIGYLGIVRGIAPAKGGLAFPGGYVDEMENIETAAAREFREEVGHHTLPSDWRMTHSAITPANRLLVFCELKYPITVDYVSTLEPNEEVQKFVVLGKGAELAFPLHQQALDQLT